MLKFQLQRHELFECELNVEGFDSRTLKPRLVLIPEKIGSKRIQFEGTFKNSKCSIPVFITEHPTPKGVAILEVLVGDSEYIEPWKSEYEVYTYKTVVTPTVKPIVTKEVKQPAKIEEIEIPQMDNKEIRLIVDALDILKERKLKQQSFVAKKEKIDEDLLSRVDEILNQPFGEI